MVHAPPKSACERQPRSDRGEAMATQWYLNKAGEQFGPFTSQQIKELASNGKLSPTDKVRRQDMKGWTEASKVSGLFPTEPLTASLIPPSVPVPVEAKPGRRNVTRIALGLASALVVMIVGAILSGVGGRDSTGDRHASDEAIPARQITASLPPEISSAETPPAHPLSKMSTLLAQEKGAYSKPEVFFSPEGSFVLALYDDDPQQDVRLWQVATGEQYLAKAPDCDYFSYPAAFSPDDASVACIDGEFLRVWNLGTSPASLTQSIHLPESLLTKDRSSWNGLRWSQDDTILLQSRSDYTPDVCVHVFQRADKHFNAIEPGHAVKKGNRHGESKYAHADGSVSPDGRHEVVALEPFEIGHVAVVSIDLASGAELAPITFDGQRFLWVHFPSPSPVPTSTSWPKHDRYSCLAFSPNGELLLVATQNLEHEPTFSILKASTWEKVGALDTSGLQYARAPEWARLRLCAFSSDGTQLAGLAVSVSKTSRGEVARRVALIFDMETGQRVQQIDLGEGFLLDQNVRDKRRSHEVVKFIEDGQALVVAALSEEWNEAKNRVEAVWIVGCWELGSGQQRFSVSGFVPEIQGSLALSPDGMLLITDMMVWDIPRLRGLWDHLAQGDELWQAGNHEEAFTHYCSVLGDDASWQLEDDLPRLWSRCLDVYAERGNVETAGGLTAYLQQRQIALAPETPQGKAFVRDFLAKQADREKLESEAKQQRLAEIRAKNKKRLAGRRLSKREFIEVMKEVMDARRLRDCR